jgi:hypothetical protein
MAVGRKKTPLYKVIYASIGHIIGLGLEFPNILSLSDVFCT